MTNQPGNEKAPEPQEPQVHIWLWRSGVSLSAAVLVIGLGLAAALALGWRSPTLRRAPDWTADDLTWKQYGDGTINFSPEGYQMRLSQPGNRTWAIADHQNASNHYLFAVGSDGYYTIAVVRDGELVPLRTWQEWPHVRRDTATNRLRVRCRGATCHFYINGEYTAEIINYTFLEGNLGVWAQSFSDTPLKVILDGMKLWALN